MEKRTSTNNIAPTMMQSGSEVNLYDTEGEKLLDAIINEDFEKVKLSLDSFYGDPDPDCQGTALLTAAKIGNAQIFEHLLMHEDHFGSVPREYLCLDIIRTAVEQGHIDILRSLFKLEECKQHIEMDVYQNADEQIQHLLYPIIQEYKCQCWCRYCPPSSNCAPRCPYRSVCIKCATKK